MTQNMPNDNDSHDINLENLLKYVKENRRVCPKPIKWTKLYFEILLDKRIVGKFRNPPLPLILSAWDSSDKSKQEMLSLHIKYAAEKGALKKVDEFIRSLTPDDWFYGE